MAFFVNTFKRVFDMNMKTTSNQFQFYRVPPENLELNQDTIDSVRRWHDYKMSVGGNT